MNPLITLRPTAERAAEGNDPRYFQATPENQLHADPSRRTTVSFPSAGLALAGHLYRPPGSSPDARTPAVVMAGPFSSVKEQTLPHYAERLADAGYTVLTFDPRSFGESEGAPRWHHDPNGIIEDVTNAVGYLLTRPDIDRERVALVGVCMGGGYVLSAAARDKRVRAVASVAGGYNIGGTFQLLMGAEGFAGYYRRINDLVQSARETGEVPYMPTVQADGLSEAVPVAAMPNAEAASYYLRTQAEDAPNWSNRMTVASLEPYFSYNAVAHAPLVAPAPLLIVHGTKDLFLLPEYAQAAYDAAVGPKELVWLETHNHIELYDQDPYVSQALAALIPWLERQLAPAPTAAGG